MGFDFFGRSPAHHVKAHHLVSALRWLASGPMGDHQAGNDRTLGLDRNAVLVVTQQVTAAQRMLKLLEEGAIQGVRERKHFLIHAKLSPLYAVMDVL